MRGFDRIFVIGLAMWFGVACSVQEGARTVVQKDTATPVPAPTAVAQTATRVELETVSFDRVGSGLPEGWKAEATHPRGPLALWEVVEDPTAPSPPKVLRVVPAPDSSGGTFNLCWTPSVRFLDGTIQVRLRADTGRGDQGGGPMWRVQDADNYYVVRYNPLENNFRLYTVKKGVRRMLDGASGIRIPAGRWLTVRIVQRGDHIQCFLDGTKLLDVHDTTFTTAGGVGLWTKADAATSFDDFTVRAAAQ
jgi:hypothetical protein